MSAPPPNAPAWVYLIPLVMIALVILRNSRARRLRIESLWVMPVLILALVGLSLSQQGMPTPLMLGVDIAAIAAGAGLGWWRGRFTHITVDPATHQLTSRASPIGMLLILGIFALRTGVRLYAAQNASALGVSAIGRIGATYAIGARTERRNIDVVEAVCGILDELRPRSGGSRYRELIEFVADRPGHDYRYAIDPSTIEQELSWRPTELFDAGLRKTVAWYLENETWRERVRSGVYRGERLGLGTGV